MVYIAIFNSEYRRQFELTVRDKAWKNSLKRHKYNVVETAEALMVHHYTPKWRTTARKHRSFVNFLHYNYAVLGSESNLVISKTKSDYLKKRERRRGFQSGVRIYNLGGGEYLAKR